MSSTMIALIVLVSLTGVIMALIYTHKKQNKKQTARLLDQFSLLGMGYDLSFSSQEILTGRMIGLDGIHRKLLLVEEKEKAWSHTLINLQDVKNCTLQKSYQQLYIAPGDGNKQSQVQEISVQFTFRNDQEPVSIVFYNHILHNIFVMAELETKAREWQVVLSKMMKDANHQRA